MMVIYQSLESIAVFVTLTHTVRLECKTMVLAFSPTVHFPK